MNTWLPIVVAALGIAFILLSVAKVIRDIVRERRGVSLRRSSRAPSLSDELDAIVWDFPRWKLP